MSTLRFTADHEYVRVEGDVGTVGITDYAQGQLGDVVFVELPAVGTEFSKGDEAAVVESVKAASEIFAPLSGEVIEVNRALEEAPATVNEDAAGKGWILKIKIADAGELDSLMDEAAYAAMVKALE